MTIPIYSFLDDIANEISSISEKLIPNLASFLVQLIALIVMIIVVIFVAYKPVRKYLDKRAQYVEDTIKQTNENNALAARNFAQSEESVLASKKEASQIISNAEKIAKDKHESMVNAAVEEITRLKLEADKDIEKSKQEAIEDIHKEMVSIALEASKEVLKREINEEDNSRMVEEFIKENSND